MRLRPTWLAIGIALFSPPGCALFGRRGPPPDYSQDPRIQAEVEARFRSEPSLQRAAIRVEVRAGQVRLHGAVQGIGAWQCAITNAGLVEGVESVVDYLLLERGPAQVECLSPPPVGTTGLVAPRLLPVL